PPPPLPKRSRKKAAPVIEAAIVVLSGIQAKSVRSAAFALVHSCATDLGRGADVVPTLYFRSAIHFPKADFAGVELPLHSFSVMTRFRFLVAATLIPTIAMV